MPPRYYLVAIWLAFIAEGAFYSRLIPLWEGFDEWGHYAFLEQVRLRPGTLPRTTDRVTDEIRESVQAAPFRHEADGMMTVFEAQQPPLYYWILSVPNRLWIDSPIATRVYVLRMVSVLLASLAIPFAYLAALELFSSQALALSVCALMTSMPGLMIDISRIGNESLAIGLASGLILLMLRTDSAILTGLCLGLGLLTKAYFLAFIPLLLFKKRFSSLAIAIGIAGWWYLRNYHLTGTLTGEIMDVAATKLGWSVKLAAIGRVHWLRVLDVALWTHIWTGAWSFFTLRSWMYRIFELLFATAGIMVLYALARAPRERVKGKLAFLTMLEALFALGIGYQAVSIFLEKGIHFAPGWYFYALIVAEALLLTSGLLILVGRRRIIAAMGVVIFLFAAMNVYSVIILRKHYTLRSFVTRPTSTHSTTKIFPA